MSNQDNAFPYVSAGQGQQGGPVSPVVPGLFPGQQPTNPSPGYPPIHPQGIPNQSGYPPYQGFTQGQPGYSSGQSGYPPAPQGWVPAYQGGFPPPVNPNAGKKSKTKIVIIGIVGILVLAVGGFFAFRVLSKKTETIKPVAPSSIWLDKGYAKGVTPRIVAQRKGFFAGMSSDRSVAAIAGSDGIYGEDLRTGKVRWELDGVDCSVDSVYEGFAYCLQEGGNGKEDILKIDLASGRKKSIYSKAERILSVKAKGFVNGNIILVLSLREKKSIVLLTSSEEVSWEKTLPTDDVGKCELLETHIGCSSWGEKYLILDARTGKLTVNETRIKYGQYLLWMTDGYTVKTNSVSSLKDVLKDFSGQEIAKDVLLYTPAFPSAMQSAFYSSADAQKKGVAGAGVVNAEGKVIVKTKRKSIVFTESGKEIKGVNVRAKAGSSDGTVVLVKTEKKLSFFDNKGKHLHDVDSGRYNDVLVRDGILHSTRPSGSVIYVPAG